MATFVSAAVPPGLATVCCAGCWQHPHHRDVGRSTATRPRHAAPRSPRRRCAVLPSSLRRAAPGPVTTAVNSGGFIMSGARHGGAAPRPPATSSQSIWRVTTICERRWRRGGCWLASVSLASQPNHAGPGLLVMLRCFSYFAENLFPMFPLEENKDDELWGVIPVKDSDICQMNCCTLVKTSLFQIFPHEVQV